MPKLRELGDQLNLQIIARTNQALLVEQRRTNELLALLVAQNAGAKLAE